MAPNRLYLTPPSKYGRLYAQNDNKPTLFNFTMWTYSGLISSSGLQSLEQYNRTYNFAACPLSRIMINVENSNGTVFCSVSGATCANCCLNNPDYPCGCNPPTCIDCCACTPY